MSVSLLDGRVNMFRQKLIQLQVLKQLSCSIRKAIYVSIEIMIIYKAFPILLQSRLRACSWPNLGQNVLLN